MKKHYFIFFLLFLIQGIFTSSIECKPAAFLTNPERTDGFGAQFQTIIYSVIYAELTHNEFRYTPFQTMEHNYDGDKEFLEKKENLINFIGNFPLNEDLNHPSRKAIWTYMGFFESNIPACYNSSALKNIKAIFRANKNKEAYFDDQHLHISVHVRLLNSHDSLFAPTTIEETYPKVVNALRELYASQNPLFHIYSQGNDTEFKAAFPGPDIILHLDESIEDTFTGLVLADVLVTTRSSFSYTAGILSEGDVYYIPFWHPPMPGWINATTLN